METWLKVFLCGIAGMAISITFAFISAIYSVALALGICIAGFIISLAFCLYAIAYEDDDKED